MLYSVATCRTLLQQVFAALAMDARDHDEMLTVAVGSPVPKFYEDYAQSILSTVRPLLCPSRRSAPVSA
jgi:hypothetical protein